MSIQISVIICTYNRARFLPKALQSLFEQDAEKDLFEVIIVDNNSSDNTEQVCKQFISQHVHPSFYYIKEPQQGSSFSRNKGAALAKGSLFCFMDDDAIAFPDYISNILVFHRQMPNVEGFGGRIIPEYIPSEPSWMSPFVSSLVGNFDYSNKVIEFSEQRFPFESNMIVTRKLFEDVQGFSTHLPGVKGELRIGGEGKDFFFRAKAKGYRIFYVPYIKVKHIVETNKLTLNYMYKVASGIGRGERIRIAQGGVVLFIFKCSEYVIKVLVAFLIATFYLTLFKPRKALPVIRFRIDVLKGFLERKLSA